MLGYVTIGTVILSLVFLVSDRKRTRWFPKRKYLSNIVTAICMIIFWPLALLVLYQEEQETKTSPMKTQQETEEDLAIYLVVMLISSIIMLTLNLKKK